ncbi:MAG: 6,7-dimethyl-8-ribityllumazine synthase [Chitinophagaceae bacterium]
MAAKGNISLQKGIPKIEDAFIVIVKTEWNAQIVNKLEAACTKVLSDHQIKYNTIIVPGAVEIPFAIKRYDNSNEQTADAFIALGTIVRGDTPHFDYVCKFITDGILSLNLTLNVPVIFGVLTVENEQQALNRAGGKHRNKGEEFAITAIKMIAINNSLKK